MAPPAFLLMTGLFVGVMVVTYLLFGPEHRNSRQEYRYRHTPGEQEFYNGEMDQQGRRKRRSRSRDSTCSVCQEDFKNGKVRSALECGHQFHQTCIAKWLRTTKNCPVCRGFAEL